MIPLRNGVVLTEEQNWIARAQRGDVTAYESLVRAYEQVAFRAAYLITRDEHEAADAAQDAFLRAYHAIGSFEQGKPFRPWLMRIVTNLALNRVQASARHAKLNEQYLKEMNASEDKHSPEQTAVEQERGERLMQAVGRLSHEERTLLSLRYFLELPEAEVAEALNVPQGTVKSRLHRTLAKLREIIQEDFPDLVELAILS